ncbi:condensin complex subunit 1 [Bacillus rossius redtenbacheri]|uniref:condensin complex subunit 1 n=1 Tax=Bacillus rossius redtenbacheri TaxID=93214 RepID=UPI002FDD5F30
MEVWDFVIPMNRDDLLNSIMGTYKVSNLYGPLEIKDNFAECKSALASEGVEFILEHFDSLYSVLVNLKKLEMSFLKTVWQFMLRACERLDTYLADVLSSDLDAEKRSRTANVAKMLVYIMTDLTSGIEDRIVQKSADAAMIDGKSRKKGLKKSESEESEWEDQRHAVVKLLYGILLKELDHLWSPPVVEQDFVDIIANCCYKLLEDSNIASARMKDTRESIMHVLGVLVKRYRHARSFIIKSMQLLKVYDHLVGPLAEGVRLLVSEYSGRSLVKELVKEVCDWQPDAMLQDPAGVRAYSQFVVELGQALPDLMLPAMELLAPFLEDEPYPMRNSVLTVMSEIVLKQLSSENLSEEDRETRDEFLGKLQEHLLDTCAFVRSKVLQLWLKLCQAGAVPIACQGPLLTAVTSRLHDKSSNVKKYAVQLLTAFMESNPFAARLSQKGLEEQYEKEAALLKTLEETHGITSKRKQSHFEMIEEHIKEAVKEVLQSDENAEDSDLSQCSLESILEQVYSALCEEKYSDAVRVLRGAKTYFAGVHELEPDGNNSVEQQEAWFYVVLKKIIDDRDADAAAASQGSQPGTQSQEPEELSRQRALLQYLKKSIMFSRILATALPIIAKFLQSSQTTDVLEAIEFFTSAYLFGLSDAATGVCKMLPLVWSQEQSIREALQEAYVRIYFATEETSPRARAVTIVKNLCGLVVTLTLGQRDSLEELIRLWVRAGTIDKSCIQVMWEKFSMKLPGTSEQESKASLILLGMVASEEFQTVSSNMHVLRSVGLKDATDLPMVKLTCEVLRKLASTKLRLDPEEEIFSDLVKILVEDFSKVDGDAFLPTAFEIVDVIYTLSDKPDSICTHFLRDLGSEYEKHLSHECSCECGEVDSVLMLTRLLGLSGHIAFRQMLFLDDSVFRELRRRGALREERKKNQKGVGRNSRGSDVSVRSRTNDKAASVRSNASDRNASFGSNASSRNASFRSCTSARGSSDRVEINSKHYRTPASASSYITLKNRQAAGSVDGNGSSDDMASVVGAVADDQEAEFIRNVCEKELVTGDNMLSAFRELAVVVCRDPSTYPDPVLQRTAALALAKMMLVSSELCDQHLQLLVSVMERSADEDTRANLVVAVSDMAYRFPNTIEPWTPHIYGRLHDPSLEVRRSTVMVLSHLIMNEMVKVKGQIADLALCIVDKEEVIAEMARFFFFEMSRKGNALYNAMPDIISRLSCPGQDLSEENFQTIFRYILGLIQKDRQIESLVEKLCGRFAAAQTERQWHDLVFCLSVVPHNERSLRRLTANMPALADKLHDRVVQGALAAIVAAVSKNAKQEVKTAVEELEEKIRECRKKGTCDEVEAENSIPQTPAARNKTPAASSRRKTVRRPRRKNSSSSESEHENTSDKENVATRKSVRFSMKKPPNFQQDSDEENAEEDDDVFVRPKANSRAPQSRRTPAVPSAAMESSSSEDEAEDELSSPLHKKSRGGRGRTSARKSRRK